MPPACKVRFKGCADAVLLSIQSDWYADNALVALCRNPFLGKGKRGELAVEIWGVG